MTPRSSCPGGEYSPLQGANLRLNYEFNTVAENCAGGELADTTFPGQPQARSWLSYGPGSFLASRPGSFLPRAEGSEPPFPRAARSESQRAARICALRRAC